MASADLESSSEMAKGSLFPHRMEGAGEPSGVSFITTLKVKVAVVPPTLCDPMGYTVRGILQARILEWVAIPFSRGSSNPGSNLALPHCSKFFTN